MTTVKRPKRAALPKRTTAIDRQALHEFLWRKTNSRRIVTFKQTELAEALGITDFALNRILREMKDAGRLRKLSHNGHMYEVEDPRPWQTT